MLPNQLSSLPWSFITPEFCNSEKKISLGAMGGGALGCRCRLSGCGWPKYSKHKYVKFKHAKSEVKMDNASETAVVTAG